ncbi:P-loop containing nucleoside triphosphate hydrolase protein [Globomyces pollinis-pini]|nr:P-loop containing nucleoside triphosphate hydrolase protein [Globomyces pollinis-pini]
MEWMMRRPAKQDHSLPSMRLLVLGESGVGKTLLIQSLCQRPSSQIQPTWGCLVEVMKYSNRTGSAWIEFVEVGGRSLHPSSILPFFKHFDGLLLVFDSTNIDTFIKLESYLNLANSYHQTPILLVGTKTDLQSTSFFGQSTFQQHSLYTKLKSQNHHIVSLSLTQMVNSSNFIPFYDLVLSQLDRNQSRSKIYGSHVLDIQ